MRPYCRHHAVATPCLDSWRRTPCGQPSLRLALFRLHSHPASTKTATGTLEPSFLPCARVASSHATPSRMDLPARDAWAGCWRRHMAPGAMPRPLTWVQALSSTTPALSKCLVSPRRRATPEPHHLPASQRWPLLTRRVDRLCARQGSWVSARAASAEGWGT
jgi:hypothetical protein